MGSGDVSGGPGPGGQGGLPHQVQRSRLHGQRCRAKFPEYPERPLPNTATKGQLVDNLDGLRDSFRVLELGSPPMLGG